MPPPGSSSPEPDPPVIWAGPPRTAAERAAYYELRWKILRAPWNQPRGSERDDREEDARHAVIVLAGNEVAAVGRVHLETSDTARLRYMAVAPAWRGRGLGRRLLQLLEAWARDMGAATVVLDARSSAAGFYRRHGYEVLGPGHTLFGSIEHLRMRRRLQETRRMR